NGVREVRSYDVHLGWTRRLTLRTRLPLLSVTQDSQKQPLSFFCGAAPWLMLWIRKNSTNTGVVTTMGISAAVCILLVKMKEPWCVTKSRPSWLRSIHYRNERETRATYERGLAR